MNHSSDKIILIDGFNLLSRGYFATSFNKEPHELQRNQDGRYVNAVNVFMTKIFQLIREQSPTAIHVSWDGKRSDILRTKAYDQYKAQRNDLPEPLVDQYHYLEEILKELNVPQSAARGYEADDIMGTLAKRWGSEMKGKVVLYSNDRDLFQLIDENITQRVAKKKMEIDYNLFLFKEEFDLHPSQWVDVKALLGDTSDNIPGCPGVGEKSAYPLIRKYHHLDGVYQAIANDSLDTSFKRYKTKLINGEKLARISYELATIETEVPLISEIPLDSLALTFSHTDAETIMQNHGLRKPVSF
ncbi:5'-3' exonuclease [Salisediminibacterium beveridgei]|uniref:5'-3' exonuclease n=1 Tax=Salisediminibacterium beveridgei TaxID=632773 RepID=A0A1D7QVI7_9BACI|nr:5'-3' exonuclease H3TH domain-containing protein [Salisediminibacterium beveridgei]AOM82989.1 DNA polymerase I [Salisediminibacterium beveridgei]